MRRYAGQIRDVEEELAELAQHAETIAAFIRVFIHDHHGIEIVVYRRFEGGQCLEHGRVIPVCERFPVGDSDLSHGVVQVMFFFGLEKPGVDFPWVDFNWASQPLRQP